jgi:hypothetical protein
MLYIISLSYIFLIQPLLEAKAEIQKYFGWFFGSNELDFAFEINRPLDSLSISYWGRCVVTESILP